MIQVSQPALDLIAEIQLKGLRLGQIAVILIHEAQQRGWDPFNMSNTQTTIILSDILSRIIPPKEEHDTRTEDPTNGGGAETDEVTTQTTSTDNPSTLHSDQSEEG